MEYVKYFDIYSSLLYFVKGDYLKLTIARSTFNDHECRNFPNKSGV